MSVYVGIDEHRKRSQLAVIDANGEVLVNRNVPNGVEPILKVIGGLPPGTPAAFEAAFGTGWLVELLEGYGFEPHLVHPLQCKAIASARLKNDKVDAEILAQLLRADLLPEAWIAPPRGAPVAGTAAASDTAGAAADAAAQPDPRRAGRPRP
jgi:transposase